MLGAATFSTRPRCTLSIQAFRDPGPLPWRDKRDDCMIETGMSYCPSVATSTHRPGQGNIVTDRVPQLFQDRHQFVPSDEARMDQEQMLVAPARLSVMLGATRPPVASGSSSPGCRIGPVRLLDDRPIDFEFLGFFP